MRRTHGKLFSPRMRRAVARTQIYQVPSAPARKICKSFMTERSLESAHVPADTRLIAATIRCFIVSYHRSSFDATLLVSSRFASSRLVSHCRGIVSHSRYSPEVSFLQGDFLEDQANSLLQPATASSESIREPSCSPTWTRYCVACNAAYGGAPVYLLFSTLSVT